MPSVVVKGNRLGSAPVSWFVTIGAVTDSESWSGIENWRRPAADFGSLNLRSRPIC